MWKRLFLQPLLLPHLSLPLSLPPLPLSLPPLPLPLTETEKTTVDLSSTKFAMDPNYAFSRSLALLISHVHSDL